MNFVIRAALATAATMLFTPHAYAYLDPGTGSLIIQGAIAAIGAALVAGRMYWTRIKSFFRRSPQDEATPGTTDLEDRSESDESSDSSKAS